VAETVQVPSAQEGLLNDPENATLWAKVDEFKAKADEFYSTWQDLRARRQAAATNPVVLKEYNDLMGEAESVTAKVSDVEFAINQAKTWAGGFFGMENVRGSFGELGILPFVIAAVAGAIAWLGTWLAKANILNGKLDAIQSLVGQGYSPERAAAAVAEKESTFFTEFGSGLGKGIALAGAVGLLLYFLFEKKRGF